MSSGFNDRPLAPFAGILSLGIGDTMVSVMLTFHFVVLSIVICVFHSSEFDVTICGNGMFNGL